MITNSKGIPVPEPTDANDVPHYLSLLAGWIANNPGIASMSTTARDALTGADIWLGRTIYNTTTKRHEVNRSVAGIDWQPAFPVPKVDSWTGGGAGGYTWVKPAGATRIRVILIGAGGQGWPGDQGRGGGGGAIVDVTLPASLFSPAGCNVNVGLTASSEQGGTSRININGTSNTFSEATLAAGPGKSGGSPGNGAGGMVLLPDGALPEGGGLWLGGPGGSAPDSAGNAAGQAAAGGGHGATSQSSTAMAKAGRGAGVNVGVGDVTKALPGGGGATRGADGFAPGGGGAGGGSMISAGSNGAVALISYFD